MNSGLFDYKQTMTEIIFSALARMEMKYVIVYVEINVKGKQ